MKETDLNSNPSENPTEPSDTSVDNVASEEGVQTAPSGRRQSLQNVRRQLTEEELSQSGTQKMLLEMLEDAEIENDRLGAFVTNYHESDKQRAILSEKLNADKSNEVFFGVGVTLGGTLIGLSPFFGSLDIPYGIVCAILGIGVLIGASIGRAKRK